MKRIIALFTLLSLFMIVFQPLPVRGAGKEVLLEGTCGKHATWTYDQKTKTLTICGTGGIKSGDWKWEDWYNSFETECYMDKVIIKDGITSIEKEAFFGAKMREVILPGTLQKISKGAFYGCTELEEIKLPSSVTGIGEEAFGVCVSLKKLIVPEGVTHIGKNALISCRSLSVLKLPKSLKTAPAKLGTEGIYALDKVVNNSRFSIPVNTVKDKITWKANGRVVRKINGGTTGRAVRKKYKISYSLHGAKISGKRKTSYRYGDSIEIPCEATKKNGCFLEWQIADGRNSFLGEYDLEEDEFPAYGNITVEPTFIYCTITKARDGSVYLDFDGKDILDSSLDMVVRYYPKKEKKKIKWKEVLFRRNGKARLHIRNLDKGKKYCFDFCLFELDSDWEDEISTTVKEDSFWSPLNL